jgi:cysteine-rich repeat protein
MQIPVCSRIAVLVALGLLGLTTPAAAQLSAPSLSNASSADENDNGANNSWDRQSAAVQSSSSGTAFGVRYRATVSSDSGAFGANKTESLISDYTITFTVTAPGAYYIDVATQLLGQLDVVYDGGLTGGSADVSAVTGSQTGGTAILSGSLGLADPGSCTIGGSSSSSCHLPFNQTGSARVFGISNGAPVSHTLHFQFTASAFSAAASGHEAAMRLGIQSRDASNSASQYPGDSNRDVNADGHFVTVTLTSLCGNGTVDAPAGSSYAESCDQGAANGTTGSCCTSSCAFKTSGVTCRTAGGVCDVAETCTGASGVCPTDAFANGGVCRPAAGECDQAESCTGAGVACPADTKKTSGTTCGDDGLPCTSDTCNGSSVTCQHAIGNTGAVCRPAAGGCDVEETCTGSSGSCPGDVLASGGSECRAAAGPCDVAESCSGSAAACPSDALAPSTQVCRPAAGVCDVAESCTGSGPACPADAFVSSAVTCRASAGVCDPAEQCTGADAACPLNALAPPTMICRPSAGVCDPKEDCDGVSPACPADRKSTNECRPSAGICDPSEACNGVGNDCPADVLAPSTTVCRAAVEQCDAAETCTGTAATCPADGNVPDGTGCDDANSCTVADACVAGSCSGDSNVCGDGVTQASCGETCDDGNSDPGDGCSATCTVEPGSGCAAAPLGGCRQPFGHGKSSLLLVKRGGVKDLFKWKWLRGNRTTVAEYGTPLFGTDYQLCLYDVAGLRMSVSYPAGGTCGTKACWKALGVKGFKYKDSELTPDGGAQLMLKEGAIGKAQIQATGRGPNLAMPPLAGLTQPITVQIQNGNGLCWEAIYGAPATTHTAEKLSDRAD